MRPGTVTMQESSTAQTLHDEVWRMHHTLWQPLLRYRNSLKNTEILNGVFAPCISPASSSILPYTYSSFLASPPRSIGSAGGSTPLNCCGDCRAHPRSSGLPKHPYAVRKSRDARSPSRGHRRAIFDCHAPLPMEQRFKNIRIDHRCVAANEEKVHAIPIFFLRGIRIRGLRGVSHIVLHHVAG